MNDMREKIKEIIQPAVERLEYEITDIEFHQGNKSLKIIVFIDHMNGIKIDDCVTVTNTISQILEEKSDLIEHYKLEVSSPGLNRKLILNEHYDRFIGKKIKVKLKTKIDNRKIYKGTLVERVNDSIIIFEDNKKINIQMDVIDVCRLVPSFE